jgi:ABC-type phosphate transport system auxiliary subunit
VSDLGNAQQLHYLSIRPGSAMSKLEQIEKSVTELTQQEFSAFAEWFERLQMERWDRQLEADAASGKLDQFADEALAEFRAKKTRPL